MDKRPSWTRIAITVAIDWRFVIAIVILLVLVLLMKQHKPPGRECTPFGSYFDSSIALIGRISGFVEWRIVPFWD
jgi:hypothetical protein